MAKKENEEKVTMSFNIVFDNRIVSSFTITEENEDECEEKAEEQFQAFLNECELVVEE